MRSRRGLHGHVPTFPGWNAGLTSRNCWLQMISENGFSPGFPATRYSILLCYICHVTCTHTPNVWQKLRSTTSKSIVTVCVVSLITHTYYCIPFMRTTWKSIGMCPDFLCEGSGSETRSLSETWTPPPHLPHTHTHTNTHTYAHSSQSMAG